MDRRKLSRRYRVLPYSTALNYARNRHRSRSIDFYVDKKNDSVRNRGRGHKRNRSIVVTGTWTSVYFARKSFASDSITCSAAWRGAMGLHFAVLVCHVKVPARIGSAWFSRARVPL